MTTVKMVVNDTTSKLSQRPSLPPSHTTPPSAPLIHFHTPSPNLARVLTTVVDSFVAEVSPFEDPTPVLTIPRSPSANSETNPFRARNSSNSGGPNTPILSVFPASPTKAAMPKSTASPGPKSNNPFLDIAAEDASAPKVNYSFQISDINPVEIDGSE